MNDPSGLTDQLSGFDRADVDEAWLGFVAQRPFVSAPVRELIIDSWKRCRTLGVDPHGRCAPAIGDAGSVDTLLRANRELLAAAAHTWDLLSPTLAETDIVLVVADARGVVLDVRGNGELVAAAARRGTGPGHDWSEQASGTNALGTAVVLGRPIIVRTAEHYCLAAKMWDCAASPVRDLSDGTLLGILDITSMGNLSDSHALALAVTAAHQIEHTLRSMELARSVRLLNWYRTAAAQWHGHAALLLDARGRVITANEAAQAACPITSLEFEIREHVPHATKRQMIAVLRSIAYRGPTDAAARSSTLPWQGGVVIIAASDDRDTSSDLSSPAQQRHPAFKAVITGDRRVMELMRRAERMARANAPILLNGETGSGKELFAQAIHACSTVAAGPFVAINCGTLSKELAASELLGYEAGAFTGASNKGRQGKFEQADGGTLFLDEIGELPLDVQVHLLRVLQDQVVVRLGGNDERRVRVRIIAATHRDLERESDNGRFRADLFFRLKVFSLTLPPLRERRDDIEPLVDRFLGQLQGVYGLGAKTATEELLATLARHSWPGNVRELHGLIESMYILSDRPELTTSDLPDDFMRENHRLAETASEAAVTSRRVDLERDTLIEEIAKHGDNMSNVARRLGISRSTLYRKLTQYGIERN